MAIDATSAWQIKDVITTIIAASGLVLACSSLTLSIWTFKRSSYFTDRTYTLQYIQDIRAWATAVLDLFEDVQVAGAKVGLSQAERANAFIEAQRRAVNLLSQGRLLLPPTMQSQVDPDGKVTPPQLLKHPAVLKVSLLQIDLINLGDLAALSGVDQKFTRMNFLKLEREFLVEISSLIRADERYQMLRAVK